jgi:type II secretory pathway component PulF
MTIESDPARCHDDVMTDFAEGRHRAEFYRLWGVAHRAGFSHPRSLETMGPRASKGTEAARQWLLDGTRQGRDVASLVEAGGARFDDFERSLLVLGDESGTLEETLRALAAFYTRKHELMLRVRKRMAYPFVTALAACFIAPLPLLFYEQTTAYLVIAFAGAALLVGFSGTVFAAVAAWYGRKPPLARARLVRALATALQAGLSLPRAIRLAADASANGRIRDHVGRMSDGQLTGGPVSQALAGCPHMTPELTASLATAEITGDYASITRLAELYEDGFK